MPFQRVDIALWDLRGKVLEQKPVAVLLGNAQRDRVLAYGTVYPLGETPDEVRRNIDRGLKLGLKAIKIVADPFWRDDLDQTARAHPHGARACRPRRPADGRRRDRLERRPSRVCR